MNSLTQSSKLLTDAWDVLALFLVPIGGGIPAGVLLAKTRGLDWLIMSGLYFISDVILACVFEPVILLFIWWSRRTHRFEKFREAFIQNMTKTVARYSVNPGAWTFILITFGTDPMTGRTVTKAAGHGFLSGWTLTIIGDMFFFWVVMGSTLWLNSILGDGTMTAIIVTVAIFLLPTIRDKLRRNKN